VIWGVGLSNFYYPDILNRIFLDILRIVTSSIAIETLFYETITDLANIEEKALLL